MDIQIGDFVYISELGKSEYVVKALANQWALVEDPQTGNVSPCFTDSLLFSYRPAPSDEPTVEEKYQQALQLLKVSEALIVEQEAALRVTCALHQVTFKKAGELHKAVRTAETRKDAAERVVEFGAGFAACLATIGIDVLS